MDRSILVSFLYMIVTTKVQASSDCFSGSLDAQEAADTYSIDQGYWYLNLQSPSSCSGQVTNYKVNYYDLLEGNNRVHIALWKQGDVEGTYEMVPLSSQVLERNYNDKRRKRESSIAGSEDVTSTDPYVRKGTFVGVFFRNSEVTLPVIGSAITSNNHKVCKQQGSTATISLDCPPSTIVSNLLIYAKVSIDVIECSALDNINEGSLVYIDGDMQYGARARYQCNTGYEIISGSIILTCNENGDWNGTIPTCQIINCPVVSEPLNGKLDETNMYSYGSVISFSCDIGFILIGNSELTCQADKSWNGNIPTCNLIQCDDPVSLTNGDIVGNSYYYGSSISFSCNEGYLLIGDPMITCQSNGSWTSDYPTCSLVNCGNPGVPDNGWQNANASYTFDSKVFYSCLNGFELNGSSMISCQANGTWSNTSPQCSAIIDCEIPTELPANVIVSGDSYTINSTITFTCNNGCKLIGNTNAICMSNKEWSNDFPKCLKQCPLLQVSDMVIITPQKGTYLEGEVVMFSCVQGYTLDEANSISCESSGIWNGTVPSCYIFNTLAITISTTTTSNVIDSGILSTTQTAVNQTDDDTNSSSMVAIAVVIPLALIGLVIVLTIVITILVLMWRKRDYKTKDNDLRETLIRLSNRTYGDNDVVPVNKSGLINPVYGGDNAIETIYSEPQFTSCHTYESCDIEDDPLVQRVVNDSNLIEESVYWEPGRNIRVIYEQIAIRNYRHIDRQEIKTIHHLGSGQFGTVDRGEWTTQDGQSVDVAIKSLKCSVSEEEQIRFLQEAAISGQFHHSNVLQLLGVVTDGHPTLIILEYLKNGDLKSYLERLKPVPGELCDDSTPSLLLRFSHQVACGMAYLSRIRFVHRDLAARNILVSEGNVCKIADFGMSKDLQDEKYYRPSPSSKNVPVPIKWTAPEAIHFKKYSTLSDVWSYGAVLYEIWSVGHKPYEQHTNQACIRLVDSGYRLPAPSGCPRSIYELMIMCWNPVSSDRPSFSKLENELAIINIDNVSGSLGSNPADNDCSLYPDLQNIYKLQN